VVSLPTGAFDPLPFRSASRFLSQLVLPRCFAFSSSPWMLSPLAGDAARNPEFLIFCGHQTLSTLLRLFFMLFVGDFHSRSVFGPACRP